MATKNKVFNNWNIAIIIFSIIAIIVSLTIYSRLKIPYLVTEPSDGTSNRFINSNK